MHEYGLARSFLLLLHLSALQLLGLAPYIVGGTLLGEALKLRSWTSLAYRHLSKPSLAAVALASVLGMASPLCTYGTVPVVLMLFRAGIPVSPLATFLAASSMMNPQLFLMTLGGLGPGMALARCLSILAFGLLLGLLLYLVPERWIVNAGARGSRDAEAGTGGAAILSRAGKPFEAKAFVLSFLDSLSYVGAYVLLGVLIGSALDVFVPKGALASIFKGGGFFRLLASSLAGIPLYACGGGVIPVVAGLLAEGMPKGSALAFLFVGPATRVTPLLALATVLKSRAVFGYVILVIAFSLLIGLAYA
jgi:uncharacterized protein